ncbi:cyclin-D-binding Myb-like transcription factor 1 [Ptychodera flava]|uniref:cyclin-D-binding Myb-like transcription factor 1 n=1 Tax=Ptychodera flava TaxID=63121 RepID=UPI003969F796
MEEKQIDPDVMPLNLSSNCETKTNAGETVDVNTTTACIIIHGIPTTAENTANEDEESQKRKAEDDVNEADEKRPRVDDEGEVAAQTVGQSLSSMVDELVVIPGVEGENLPTQEPTNEELQQRLTTTEPSETGATLPQGSEAFTEEADPDPVSQCWFTTKEDKDTLACKGHKWKQGMWSKDEIMILQQNIDEYVKARSLRDPQEIIFDMTKDERKDFYRSIAKGLNRPLFAIYRRVLRMYDSKNHMGKYTPEETEKLKELHSKHGNDWAAIGAALGRSASSVKDRCRLILKDSNHSGKWFPEEENRLTTAVYELSNVIEGESITSGISWAAVAERVGTRSEKQCRSKWLNYLNWKQTGGTEWSKDDDRLLLNRIEELGVQNENEINWVKLSDGWQSVRSPQWLRSKWWALKRHIQDHSSMTLSAIIESLRINPGPLTKQKPERPHLSPRVKITRMDQVSVKPTIVHVPIPIPQRDGAATITTTTVAPADSEEDGSNQGMYQSYEVMQSTMTLAPGAFLIQNPQHVPTSLSGSPTSTDQIIVQTVPVSDALHSNENVTVQMNPQNNAHIIITSSHSGVPSLSSADISSTCTINHTESELQDSISQSDDLHNVSQSDDISQDSHEHLSSQISQSDLAVQQHITSQGQLISQHELMEQDITASDMTSEVSQSEPTLVIVSASSITGTTTGEYVQATSSGVDSHLSTSDVFTLTGPILQSQSDTGEDLIGSSSDIEVDKSRLDDHDLHDGDLTQDQSVSSHL